MPDPSVGPGSLPCPYPPFTTRQQSYIPRLLVIVLAFHVCLRPHCSEPALQSRHHPPSLHFPSLPFIALHCLLEFSHCSGTRCQNLPGTHQPCLQVHLPSHHDFPNLNLILSHFLNSCLRFHSLHQRWSLNLHHSG